MAKPKKFDSYDNDVKFDEAADQLQEALGPLHDFLDREISKDINNAYDDMRDAYAALTSEYESLAAQVEDLQGDAAQLTESEKSLGEAVEAIEVLQARLSLAGLSTSTAKPRNRRRALGRNPLDC